MFKSQQELYVKRNYIGIESDKYRNYLEKELKVPNQKIMNDDYDVKPILKWVGGKRQKIYFKKFLHKYVEPWYCSLF